jgi:long-subunit fatty acid transport protein
MRRIASPIVTALLCVSFTSRARAGGFETPDNGTEALGRGGAFTAKASDATALEYNVAGLANQRGTRVLFDGKVSFDSYSFTRQGAYPADNPATPWSNKFFPTVSNQGTPFFAPFVGLSTDFGYFDRLTVAVGAFGPSGVGNPVFPYGLSNGVPSPSRYDILAASSTIVLPTIAAAYRLTDWLDVGGALHYVAASFNLSNTSFVDIGCTVEEYKCDTINALALSGTSVTGSGGLMLHPDSWLDIGLNVRAPINITASGTVNSTTFAGVTSSGAATLQTALPWNIRAGARAKWNEGNFERGDLELDAVYEPWGSSASGGNVSVSIPSVAGFTNVDTVVRNNFEDVFSLRFGGALNLRTGGSGILTLRGGAYYESSSTQEADTRLDFNTLAKYAGTLGIGFSYRGIAVNLAFAEIYSAERTVTDGDVAPVNPAQHGQSIDSNGKPLLAVNNGTYDGGIQMLSVGLRVEIETLLGTNRSKRWWPQGALPFDGGPAAVAPAQSEPSSEESAEARAVEKKGAPARPARAARIPAPTKKAMPRPPADDSEKTKRLEDPFAT